MDQQNKKTGINTGYSGKKKRGCAMDTLLLLRVYSIAQPLLTNGIL
jgi:hypothetical protein